jgi:hypothetical protein
MDNEFKWTMDSYLNIFPWKMGVNIMVKIAKYKGEIFWIKYESIDKYLLATSLMIKAEKVGFPWVERGGWESWVLKKDVEILGDKKELGINGDLI